MHWPAQQHWKGWKTAKNVMDETPSWYLAKWRTQAGAALSKFTIQKVALRIWIQRVYYEMQIPGSTEKTNIWNRLHSCQTWWSQCYNMGMFDCKWNQVTSVSALKCTGLYALLRFKWFRYCSSAVRGSFRSPTYSFCPPPVQSSPKFSKDSLEITLLVNKAKTEFCAFIFHRSN